MANSDKNIRITTSKNKTTYPNIVFTGSAAGSSVITLEVLDDNTLSFTSNEGQVFSIDSNLSTGTIWAVSDISGIPLLSASAGGTIGLGVYGGVVGIGQTNPTYKLDLKGNFGLASSNDGLYNFIFSNSAASGSNSLQVRSANSILLYNSGNTFYTGLKSNAAANVTYTLPTTDGSADQFLKTNGSGTLSWGTPAGGSGGGGTGVGAGGQYEVAVYPSTGSSVVGYSSLKNDVVANVVSISHSTVATNHTNGALTVTGGVGIGGSLYVAGIGASITGVTFSNSTITRGTWNGTVISTVYGGTGLNLTGTSGILTVSSGTVSASTTSSAISSALTDETGSGSLVFNTSPSFGTGVTTNSATFAVFNTNATTINAFGAATAINFGASTGKATFNSTDDSTSSTTGGLVVSGGAGFAKSISIAGRLQLLNGANVTAFVSSGTGNTVYILPPTTPATGTSVLQSDSIGNLSWVAVSSGSGLATTSTNVYVNSLGNPNSFHPVLMTPVQSSAGSAVSANGTVVYNPSTDILYSPGFAVTSGVDSSSTTTGALQVRGGIGVTGTGFFDIVRTRAIVTTGDVTIAGNLAVNGTTIDFGNATTDSISFIGRVDTSILPISNNLYDLGSTALAFRNASIGSSLYFTNSANTNTFAFTAGATGTTLTYVLPIDTPTTGQVLAASAISGSIVTLSWEDDQTGAPAGGITTLNTLTAASQSFSTGTSGSDFNISSVTSTHTFNIPDAGSSARGLVTTGTQTLAGAKTFSSALSVTDSTAATSTSTGALIVSGGAGIAGSLFTGTGFSSSISGVVLANGNVSATTYNKLTLTAPATSATLTLANGSSLITSGANSLTITTTATSSVTMPTAGTLTTTGNKLSVFAATTSSELSGIISDETGSGVLVFNSQPSFGTGVTTGDSTFAVFNTNATTINAFGAATTLNLGATTGKATIRSTDVSTSTTTGSLVVSGGAGIAGSLFTGTGFSSSISGVILANGNVSATTYNKLTFTTPATSATLTLANGSSLITSGANSLTFTTTATTNVTLPVAGTLTTTGNDLSVFAATTSLQLKNLISDETGSGALVFATSPDFTTSVTTNSATFSLFNATATNISAFGAATVMSIGAATGKATFNSTDNSTSTTTGGFVVSGGAGIAKSLSVGGGLQMFNGANYTTFISAATANTIYTLPPTSPATGSSVLQSTSAGVMSWVPMTAGGGPSGTINSSSLNNIAYYTASTTLSGDDVASGNYFQYNGTTNGLNVAHADNEFLPSANTGLLRIGTGATDYAVRKALAVISTNNAWTDGDLLVLGVGKNVADTRVGIDYRGYIQIGVPGTGFTLPITNGSSGQVLTANTNGVASWTTVSSSGAGSGTVAVPGAQYQVAAYYHSATGASVSGSSTFTNNTATGVVNITHTTESTSTSTGALTVSGGAGIAKTASVGQIKVGTLGYAATNVLSAFQSSINGFNQVIVQNTNSGASASANFIVNNNLSTDSTYYGEFGMNSSAFSGSGALSAPNAVYLASATGPLVLGTVTSHPIRFVVNNGATDMIYITESGTAISVFANLGLRSASDLRFWNSGNTFYAGIQGGNTAANYLLTLPTAPVGAGYSTILVDSSGNMYFAPVEGGMATTSATGNRVVLRNKMEHHVWMAAGFTPLAAGADNIIYRVPDSSEDGSTLITFRITEFSIRVETPSAGSSRIQVERSSTDTGAFTLAATGSSIIGGLGLTIAGAGVYVTSTNTFPAGIFVTSGNLIRLNWTLLNATHANFSVQFTLNEV